jgi:hypothetical protein
METIKKTTLEKVTLEKMTDSLQNLAKSLLRDLTAYKTSNQQQYDQFNLVHQKKKLHEKILQLNNLFAKKLKQSIVQNPLPPRPDIFL